MQKYSIVFESLEKYRMVQSSSHPNLAAGHTLQYLQYLQYLKYLQYPWDTWDSEYQWLTDWVSDRMGTWDAYTSKNGPLGPQGKDQH